MRACLRLAPASSIWTLASRPRPIVVSPSRTEYTRPMFGPLTIVSTARVLWCGAVGGGIAIVFSVVRVLLSSSVQSTSDVRGDDGRSSAGVLGDDGLSAAGARGDEGLSSAAGSLPPGGPLFVFLRSSGIGAAAAGARRGATGHADGGGAADGSKGLSTSSYPIAAGRCTASPLRRAEKERPHGTLERQGGHHHGRGRGPRPGVRPPFCPRR